MKKSSGLIYNVLMLFAILAIAFGGFTFVKNIKSGDAQQRIATVENVKGIAKIERQGVGYPLKNHSKIVDGDIISTLDMSEVRLSTENGDEINIGEMSELAIGLNEKIPSFTIKTGSFFCDFSGKGSKEFLFGENKLLPQKSVLSITKIGGNPSINVYGGNTDILGLHGENLLTTSAGNSVFTAADGSLQKGEIHIGSMSKFEIDLSMQHSGESCFTYDDLSAEVQKRQDRIKNVLDEKKRTEERLLAEIDAEIKTKKQDIHKPKVETEKSSNTATSKKEQGKSTHENDLLFGDEWQLDNVKNDKEKDDDNDHNTQAFKATISIRCDTILSNIENLAPGKNSYVPNNGEILESVEVEFSKGETVYDVLKSVCKTIGIQIECSWTPIYNSYYIEGINNLYEFDCGSGSGWIYHVNGWKPNYGISVYELKDGDIINLDYTCDYGDDL